MKPTLKRSSRIFILTAFGTLVRLSQERAAAAVKELERREFKFEIDYTPLNPETGSYLAIIKPA